MMLGPITIGGAGTHVTISRGATWQMCPALGLRWRLVAIYGPVAAAPVPPLLVAEDRELQQAWICVASDDPAVSVGTVEWRDVPTAPRGV